MTSSILRLARKLPPCPGGMEFHVRDLSRRQAIKARVDLIYSLGEAPSARGLHSYCPPFAGLIGRIGSDSLQALAFCLLALPIACCRPRPEIVHVHGDIVEVLCGRFLARWHNARLVATFHAGLNRSTSYRRIARHILARLRHAIGVSPAIVEELISLGFPRRRCHWIHSGIPYHSICSVVYDTRTFTRSHGRLRLLAVGRLHPMKGLSVLLAACRLADHRNGVELVIVGDGPMAEELRKAAANLEMPIRFTGGLTRQRVLAELAEADVFVQASLDLANHREGTPTAIMEAMAAGLPIIATKVGGTTHILQDGQGGLLVEPDDPSALAQMIDRACADHTWRQQASRKNLSAAENFDWTQVVARIDAVYHE